MLDLVTSYHSLYPILYLACIKIYPTQEIQNMGDCPALVLSGKSLFLPLAWVSHQYAQKIYKYKLKDPYTVQTCFWLS